MEPVRSEYDGAAAAISWVARAWAQIRDEPELSRVSLTQISEAALNLEATYIIRVFAEFEAILTNHIAVAHPTLRVPRTAEALINRVALRERIPDPLLDTAQGVRAYRNVLVHHRIAPVPTQSLPQVMAGLNRFLARLP
jgi:hypothetical protein